MERRTWIFGLGGAAVVAVAIACSTLPKHKHKKYIFPKEAHLGIDPGYPFEVMGPVKDKQVWASLDMENEEKDLCKNYFNHAAGELLKYAKKAGGDGVIEVRSVVFLMDGRTETYETPECSDDGEEGQVLVQGVAIKRKRPGASPSPSPSPSVSPSAEPSPEASQSATRGTWNGVPLRPRPRPSRLMRNRQRDAEKRQPKFDPELDGESTETH